MSLNFWADARYPRSDATGSRSTDGDHDQPGPRSVFQHDYDRLLFSTPVRRLADKTQVWPFDENDGIRTRLTHSHEVANLARSIGTRAYHRNSGAFGSADLGEIIQPILSAIGLAHDLGNPPFGHQGETAVGRWFSTRATWIFDKERDGNDAPNLDSPVPEQLRSEFTSFDGNPQSFRLVTKLQTHHARVGLDLSAATLAALLKYPVHVSGRDKSKAQLKKGGYFESERSVVEWIRAKTGLGEGQRHPLTWIMEACDDIAYSVLDVDDLLKKEVLSPDDVSTMLRHNDTIGERDAVKKVESKFTEVSKSERRAEIRYEIKIQYLRAYMFEALIGDASKAFLDNAGAIMSLSHDRALMDGNALCDALKQIAGQYGFRHPSVLRTEAVGAAVIDGLMSALWHAIVDRECPDLWSERTGATACYVYALISPNYIEAAQDAATAQGPAANLRYRELRLLTDMISGMTDTFAARLWQDIRSIPDAGRI